MDEDPAGVGASSAPASTLSAKLRATAELFDVISGNGEIDHPLCEECTDGMLEAMDEQLKREEEDVQEYRVSAICLYLLGIVGQFRSPNERDSVPLNFSP